MHTLILRHSVKRIASIATAAALLSIGLFASLGAGPDDPKASNVNNDWEIFEGHAYADSRAAPAGISLIACLGGCEDGYQTAPVITGMDGMYRVKVEPGQILPTGRMVTFWLVDGDERVEADQDVLFRGEGEVRVLDLNFIENPSQIASGFDKPSAGSAGAGGSTAESGAVAASGSGAGAGGEADARTATGGVTTDLTVPSANELGLAPNSPQTYVNTVSYGGLPLLPGFVTVFGLILAAVGVSVLLYRRRLTWQ